MFVSIDRFLVVGKIPLKDLSGSRATEGRGESREDRWVINESIGRATAQRSGAVLAVGDIVTVQIIAVNLASRHLDLRITGFPDRPPPKPGKKGAREERHADERGTRRGKAIGQGKTLQRGKRKGFKQGRRGRRSR